MRLRRRRDRNVNPSEVAHVTRYAIDKSSATIPGSAIPDTIEAVALYVTHASWCVTEALETEYHDAGKAVVFVFEDAQRRPLQGSAAGQADARFANDILDQHAVPLTIPIYYAYDFDTDVAAVQGYANGVAMASHGRRQPWAYGSDRVCVPLRQASLIGGWWQSASRSFSDVWPHPDAAMVQQVGRPVTIPGIPASAYDVDIIQHDNYGGWYMDTFTADDRAMLTAVRDALGNLDPTKSPALHQLEERLVRIEAKIDALHDNPQAAADAHAFLVALHDTLPAS